MQDKQYNNNWLLLHSQSQSEKRGKEMGLGSKSIINYSYNVASFKNNMLHDSYHKAFQISYLCNYPQTSL